jgi:D-sedoheptulose 7-phosphate isomerase
MDIEKITEEVENYLQESLKTAKYQIGLIDSILEVSQEMQNTINSGGKIIFCGNGGSAADSQHLAAELVVRFKENRNPIPAISLTTDTSVITSIGNDFGFDFIFSRQLEAVGDKKDFLVVITTSGKSQNIIEAVKQANEMDIKVLSLTGRDTSLLEERSSYIISIPSDLTGVIQQAHITLGQIFCKILELNIINKK